MNGSLLPFLSWQLCSYLWIPRRDCFKGSQILRATSCYKQRLPLNLSDWEQTCSVLSCFRVGSYIIKSISIQLYVGKPFFYSYSTSSLLIGHSVDLEPVSEAQMLVHSKHREHRSYTVHLVLFFIFQYHFASVILQLLMFSFFAIIFTDFPVC